MAERAPTGILGQSLQAGRWSLINTIVQRVLVFGTFFVLARFLLPADFGIIALIAIVPNFLDGITALAFDTAALQRGNIERYLNAIWTFNVLRGTVLMLIVFATAPYVASFFHIEYALLALELGGIGLFLHGFVNMGQTYFFLDLDFRKVFLRDLALQLTYAAAAIAFALSFHNFWALFIGNLVSIVALVIATYVLHPFRPRFDFEFSKLAELFRFSQWLLGQEILNQSVRTAEDSLIGRFTTPSDLGLYGKAKSLATAPTSPVVSLISKVSFSSYARLQDSLEQVRDGVNKSLDVVLAIAIPYLIIVLATGNRLVLLLLGSNWTSITPYLKILVIGATFDMVFVTLTTPVFNALGKPRTKFFVNVVYAVTILIAFVFLVPRWGIFGASIATAGSLIVTALITLYQLRGQLQMSFTHFLSSTLVAVLACVLPVILAFVSFTQPFFNHSLGYCLVVVFAGVLYGGGLYFMHRFFRIGPYPTFFLILRSILSTS